MNDAPKFFITVCMFCKKEKSREPMASLTKDVTSHGICKTLCEPGKNSGWSKYVPKEHGGDL